MTRLRSQNLMPYRLAVLLALAALALLGGCGPKQAPKRATAERPKDNPDRVYQLRELPLVTVQVANRPLKLYVADSFTVRQEGLTFVNDKELGQADGMIFVYADARLLKFWNVDTPLALDVAFLDAGGEVQRITSLKPFQEEPVGCVVPAKFVIQVRAGMLAQMGVKEHMTAVLPPTLRTDDPD